MCVDGQGAVGAVNHRVAGGCNGAEAGGRPQTHTADHRAVWCAIDTAAAHAGHHVTGGGAASGVDKHAGGDIGRHSQLAAGQ